ncbi:hypothetical protein R1flu_005380 [Riccia fluitans]|uniref:Uncharacterized protein n=1 Tax=Riccia fluitans TaxID=41844 RepID=A0ABD1YT09_9MARC
MYENLTQILVEMVHLGIRMGLIYMDLILEASTRFRHNKEWISGFKEEVKKVSRLIKDAIAFLTDVKDIMKANKQRIAELTKKKGAAAVLQVRRGCRSKPTDG